MLKSVLGLTTLVLLLCLIGYATSGGPSDPRPAELGLTAVPLRQANGAWLLQFELEYTGGTPLVVDEQSLPWNTPRDLVIEAVQLTPAGPRLAQPVPRPRELPRAALTLHPGETVSGQVHLSARLPALAAALRESEVVLFWSHQLQSEDHQPLPRLSGGVVIPKQN
jgi:hypothetical protein